MSIHVYIHVYHTRKTGKEVTRKEEGRLHYMVVKKKRFVAKASLTWDIAMVYNNLSWEMLYLCSD